MRIFNVSLLKIDVSALIINYIYSNNLYEDGYTQLIALIL